MSREDCSNCQYNAYRMLGEEVKKLNKPDNCGERYNPFSQNGKAVQIATYIQTAYRDGYKHGYKDGYKIGFEDGRADADGKYFEDGYKQGYEQHGKDGRKVLYKIITVISAHLSNAEKDSKRTQDDVDCGICIGLQMALDTISWYKKESEEQA